MILVLAGTGEGREAAVRLEKMGNKVVACTATAYGGQLLAKDFKGKILAKPLGLNEMLQLISEKQVEKVVDATHPFAVEVSRNAREACRRQAVTYERVVRETEKIPEDEEIIRARDLDEAVQLALTYSKAGNFFLTTGSSKLEYYTEVLSPERLVVRILPVRESLEKCLALGILPENIIAMQGPFDEAINRMLFKRYKAGLVISKESGARGGAIEKIKAAKSLKLPLILISRPLERFD